jgi:D-3-phosphoglycerate dehydrogenase
MGDIMRLAVLDDWQSIARDSADWSAIAARAEIVFFHEAFASEDDAAEQLADFEIIVAMRERTAFPASLVKRLTKLKFFSLTGKRAGTIDFAALQAAGVTISTTDGGDSTSATAELTLGLILAAARGLTKGENALRAGQFQVGTKPGVQLSGRTLGLIGLGKIGGLVARYGQALGMKVIAWSPNLTQERADPHGVAAVSKAELLAQADVISLHMVLSPATRALFGATDLAAMKAGAILVNTSRAGLIDEAALVAELQHGRITAALDVFSVEPLPANNPIAMAPNTVLSPHLGYGSADVMRAFYRDSVENVAAFLDGRPVRVMA